MSYPLYNQITCSVTRYTAPDEYQNRTVTTGFPKTLKCAWFDNAGEYSEGKNVIKYTCSILVATAADILEGDTVTQLGLPTAFKVLRISRPTTIGGKILHQLVYLE